MAREDVRTLPFPGGLLKWIVKIFTSSPPRVSTLDGRIPAADASARTFPGEMNVRTRFAPSPTGQLHLGHAYAAWVAWEFARRSGGEFILRHEDIDATRVRDEFHQGIEADLRWLGLCWSRPALRQTERQPAYHAALEKLKQMEVAYPCFCTRKQIQDELARMGGAPHGPDPAPYPGTCRRLDDATRAELLQSGGGHSWRLDSEKAANLAGNLFFLDLQLGSIPVAHDLLGDVILARKDIGVAYHLAVVIDDAHQRISHVTRGDDLLAATHVHRLIQALLGLPQPLYYHHPLVLAADGRRLAKRDDDVTLASLRDDGCSPQEVLDLARRGMPTLPAVTHPAAPP
jgi:glutamyl-Q tRNA(Asp) synthetase